MLDLHDTLDQLNVVFVCVRMYVLYTASIDRLELNSELEGVKNKAVVVCCNVEVYRRRYLGRP
jgi:hypothetical protein